MKKYFLLLSVVAMLVACNENIVERAEREAREFTERNCPAPPVNNSRLDSITVDKATRTYIYHNTFIGPLDNDSLVSTIVPQLDNELAMSIANDTNSEKLKKAKFNFRFIVHSESQPAKIYYDHTFTPEEYGAAPH